MAGKQRVNPAQAIGVYYATPPTIADGDTGEVLLDANGRIQVVATGTPSGTQDVNVKQLNGNTVSVGAGAVGTGVQRVTLASDDPLVAKIPASLGAKAASASLSVVQSGMEYETVAAAQTAQVLGATGATGDFLSHVILQPAATNAGTTTILDNATVIFTYTAGTLADLRPIVVPFGLFSVSGAWKVTTGASMAVIGIGDFT